MSRIRMAAVLAATSWALGMGGAPADAHLVESCYTDYTLFAEMCPKPVQGEARGNNALALTPFGDVDESRLDPVGFLPKNEVFTETDTNSDIAFWGDYLFQGNYKGFQIVDISTPTEPAVVAQKVCPGSQNDISVWKDLIVTSTDSARNTSACENNTAAPSQTVALGQGWEGLRIFDWSTPSDPQLVAAVKTKCGSHTHTTIPDEVNDRLLVYVSSYGPGANANCLPPHDLISIVEIPLEDPRQARVLKEVTLFPVLEGIPQSGTSGCHDITAYPEIGLAAGACMGEGILMDIKDPANPRKIATLRDPNFSFWHSATFSNDGKKVIFTDELGGGTAARCTDAYGENQGADALYDISDPAKPKFLSYFKIPRFQTNNENCVSHNGSLLPHPTRDLLVQAWYQGGTSIVDFTDAANPREVAYFDRGPISETRLVSGGHWSSYWYNGHVYANEIYRGLDVLRWSGEVSGIEPLTRLNAQTQEKLPAFSGTGG